MAKLALPPLLIVTAIYAAALLAIIGPHASPALLAKGYHELTLDLSAAPRSGLVGGQAYILYPGGYLFQEVDPGNPRVSFRVPLDSIEERAAAVEESFRSKGFVEYATLSVTLYYLDSSG